MPRKSVPSYCQHKASGQAYVKISGKRIYLGKHGTPDSHRRYSEEIAKWQAEQEEPPTELSTGELSLLYFEHCKSHYQKDGKPTSKVHVVQAAIRALNRQFRTLPAAGLTPRRFKAVREKLVSDDKHCRNTINDYMGVIRRMVKWAVSEELLPPEKLIALQAVPDLQRGRSDARESEPIKPVSLADVEAIEGKISRPLWGAIQFQLATACRPTEALRLRLCDLDRSGDVWLYTPESHKTEHHGKGRLVLIGPKGQAVIDQHTTTTDPEAYVSASRRGTHYRRDSYTNAIKRACKRAGIDSWAPNQLRHTAATLIRKSADVETAKTILGHSELRTTEIYAERELQRAAEIIKKIG